MKRLSVGTRLVHVYNNIQCTIIRIDQTSIVVDLDECIDGKKTLELPISHLGQYLFFDISDTERSDDNHEFVEKYIAFGNKQVVNAYNKINGFKSVCARKSIEDCFKKSDQEEFLNGRGVYHFIHFTNINNLKSILKYGILPVSELKRKSILSTVIRNDKLRLDKREETVSLSIGFPNYKYFYKVRKSIGGTWVILIVDIKTLDFKKMSYCKDNASAFREAKGWKSKYLLSDLKELFGDYDAIRTRKSLNIPDCYTTNPQSEVLYRGSISAKSIKKICFASNLEREQFINENKDIKSIVLNKCVVKSSLFNVREDYEWWKKGSKSVFLNI